ncbi:N-formylglutamate amidohydrolase, partial [bacterium]|nr:N-formylglutamate amidohydrolase [bacterium]
TNDDAWGIEVWRGELTEDVVERSLLGSDDFYAAQARLYRSHTGLYGHVLVLDLHSYNHLRDGPAGPPADPAGNPQINVGTGTLTDRDRWAPLIDRFMSDLAAFEFPGGRLDVRENVRFRGGACAAWAHRVFPEAVCVLSVEVKKFFMDEWTGVPDETLVDAVGSALQAAQAGVVEELERM